MLGIWMYQWDDTQWGGGGGNTPTPNRRQLLLRPVPQPVYRDNIDYFPPSFRRVLTRLSNLWQHESLPTADVQPLSLKS